MPLLKYLWKVGTICGRFLPGVSEEDKRVWAVGDFVALPEAVK